MIDSEAQRSVDADSYSTRSLTAVSVGQTQISPAGAGEPISALI